MGKGCLACPYGYSVGEEWFQHGLNNNHCLLVGAMSSTMCIPHCEKSFRFVQKLCLFFECLIWGSGNKGLYCMLTWGCALNNNHCLLVGAALFAFNIVKNNSDLCKNFVCFWNVWSAVYATKGCLAYSHGDVAWITIIACLLVPWAATFAHHIFVQNLHLHRSNSNEKWENFLVFWLRWTINQTVEFKISNVLMMNKK